MPSGVYKRTNKHKKITSEAIKKVWQNPEYKKRMKLIHKGKKLSEEHCKNISLALKGRKLSEETKRKIGQGNKGKKLSEDAKRKVSEFNKGRKYSKKHKKKLSIMRKERMKNPKLRKIILESLKLGRYKNKNTKIELKIKKQLKRNNIIFKQQYELKEFICDFYLPKYNLLIEADGTYWHNYPKGTENDKKKNKVAKGNGYKIIHIWENEINKIDFNIMNYLGEF